MWINRSNSHNYGHHAKDTYSEKWFKVLTFNNVVFTWKNCKRRDKTLKNDLGPKKMVFGYFHMYLQQI